MLCEGLMEVDRLGSTDPPICSGRSNYCGVTSQPRRKNTEKKKKSFKRKGKKKKREEKKKKKKKEQALSAPTEAMPRSN